MTVQAYVEPDVCIVTGTCEAMVPELFGLDDDGTLRVLLDPVPPHLAEQARAAAAACPSRALRLRELAQA